MSSFLQDGTGDLVLTTVNGGKRLTLVTDPTTCAAQKLTNRFLIWLGEWFLDTRVGFPYFQQVAVKNPNLRVLKQLFSKVVLSVPPIVSIDFLTVTLGANRQAQVALRARTDTGQTIVGGEGNTFIVENA